MKKKIVSITGLVLLVLALVAMPASAGYNQGGSTCCCHGVHAGSHNCVEYSYGNGQCDEYGYQTAENHCFRNSGDYCLNNGTCTFIGTGYGYGNANPGNCPCI